jgi:hypothetical protein
MKIVSIILSLAIGTAFAETVPTTTQPVPDTTTVVEKPLRVRANLNQWRKENQEKRDAELAELSKPTKD